MKIRRAEGFTLHGLWPNLDNECQDDYPEKCSDDEFDASALNCDTYSDMKEVWPSYTTGGCNDVPLALLYWLSWTATYKCCWITKGDILHALTCMSFSQHTFMSRCRLSGPDVSLQATQMWAPFQ